MKISRILVLVALVVGSFTGFAQRPIPIANQAETDWQDDRWNEMQSGRFQSFIVPLPSGTLLKGFGVLVGEKGEATVCYDTASSRMLATWSEGLFHYSPRKFGVVDNPLPAGKVREWLPVNRGDAEGASHWGGFNVNGPQVVVRFDTAGREVLETPWWEPFENGGAITRSFSVSPGDQAVRVPLMKGETVRTLSSGESSERRLFNVKTPAGDQLIVAVGDTEAFRLRIDETKETVILELSESKKEQRVKLFFLEPGVLDPAAEPLELSQFDQGDHVRDLMSPGPKEWPSIPVRGQHSKLNVAYAIDTLTVPYENPWNALMFLSGIDFLPNGDAAVCTMFGDVWLVKGINESLDSLHWHRFATGLFQPLGLQVLEGVVHVLGRDQITALHDLNGDDFADFYRNHSNLIKTSAGHNFVTSLQSDSEGNLYYVDPQGLHKVSADGASLETIATGWRNPNGLGRSPDGILTVAPQQGGWTPSSQISEVKQGGFYGAGGPRVSESRPLGYDPPLCWIPHSIDNSGGSQVWAPSSGWGPLSGQMIHLSYGRCSMMVTLRDVVNGQAQGGVVPIRGGRFLSGAMRGAVSPKDGQLYVVGAKGWQTSALRDGSLQRVRYTGKTLTVPIELKVFENGVSLVFADALDAEWAGDSASYGIKQWNYRYSKEYGSKDYSVANPEEVGRDEVAIKSIQVSSDNKSVFLVIPSIKPVMQMEVRYNLRSEAGDRVRSTVYHTIHQMRPAKTF
jgi:hypothetical protein